MAKSLRQMLKPQLRGEVSTAADILRHYSRDAGLFTVKPKLVAYPLDTKDIQSLVRFVAKHKGLSLTARSGGTDMTGGPLTESIVVDLSRHLNNLGQVTECCITTEPGVFYRDFEQATLKHNLLLPSYPASREICTIGGMVANNAGGEKTLAFGKTEDYVQKIKMVLRDGHEYTFSALNKQELTDKMKLETVEGEIYRDLYSLITKNYDLLQSAKPQVSKNSAGYYLWNVWNPKTETFDLTKLITGSQGTLGIITEITFRLITPKPHAKMLVIFMNDLSKLGQLVKTVLGFQPESFESYDDHTLKLSLKFLPSILKHMSTKNFLSLGLQFLPEFRMLLTGGIPKLILIAEFTGYDKDEIFQRAQAAQAAVKQFNVKTSITKTKAESEKYWVMRRESFNILRQHVKGKRTAPFIDDIIIKPAQLPDFLPRLNSIMDDYDLTYTIAGHVGDANFHIIPLMDLSRPDLANIISELSDKVYTLVLEFNGSITAEHNDGLIRSHYLEKMYGTEVYRLFEKTKEIFDPDNIFNPGKKVNADWAYAKKHLIKD